MSEAIAADPSLLAEGWEQRYLADENRAAEARELYSALGYEVLERQLDPDDFGQGCGECPVLVVCGNYVMVYTRKRGPAGGKSGEEPAGGRVETVEASAGRVAER